MAHSHHKLFDFALGLSALGAASGMNRIGQGQQVAGIAALANANAASLEAISRAVEAGLIPPPPRRPSLPTSHWGAAGRAYRHAMWNYEAEMEDWRRQVAATFAPPRKSSGGVAVLLSVMGLIMLAFILFVVAVSQH